MISQPISHSVGLSISLSAGRRVKVRNDAFRLAGAMISRFATSMFEASDAESVEGLQILQGSFRVAVRGVRMPRLNSSWQAQYF